MQASRSVLFVCLGNICRSPMCEIVMRYLVKERGVNWVIDSAGTAGYHVGESPDPRTVSTCKKFLKDKMPPVTHKARQIQESDFHTFDYILCMDKSNLRDLNRIRPAGSKAHVDLLGSFDPEGELIIEDPYYGGTEGFEHNFQQIMRCCNALIDKHLN